MTKQGLVLRLRQKSRRCEQGAGKNEDHASKHALCFCRVVDVVRSPSSTPPSVRPPGPAADHYIFTDLHEMYQNYFFHHALCYLFVFNLALIDFANNYIYMFFLSLSFSVYMFIYIYTSIYLSIYIYTRIYMHICIYILKNNIFIYIQLTYRHNHKPTLWETPTMKENNKSHLLFPRINSRLQFRL